MAPVCGREGELTVEGKVFSPLGNLRRLQYVFQKGFRFFPLSDCILNHIPPSDCHMQVNWFRLI